MIRFCPNTEIDRDRWDQLVEKTSGAKVYNLSWYLDSICDNWCALIEDDYIAALALPTKEYPGARILYQPFFSRELSILSEQDLSAEKAAAFLQSVPSSYKSWHFGLTPIQGFDPSPIEWKKYPYQVLKLSADYGSISAGYATNARRILKKQDVLDVRPTEGRCVAELFEEHTAERIDLNNKDLERLKKLIQAAEDRDLGFAIGAYSDNVLVAGGFFIRYRDEVIYLKGASSPEGRKAGAMYFIMDKVIRGHSQCRQLDFGGSRIREIADFFRKFGAEDNYYLLLSKKLPFFLNLGRRVYQVLKKIA